MSVFKCPACGGVNEVGSRFCGDCGQPLPSGPLPEANPPSGNLNPPPTAPGGTAPLAGPPAGGTAPIAGPPAGGTAPLAGPPAGGTAPIAGPPAGGTAPLAGPPAGGTAPLAGSPAGGTAPIAGPPAGGTAPIAGPPAGGMAPGGALPTAPAVRKGLSPVMLGGVAAAAVVALAVGGFLVFGNRDSGGGSVYLDNQPASTTSAQTVTREPAPAPPQDQPPQEPPQETPPQDTQPPQDQTQQGTQQDPSQDQAPPQGPPQDQSQPSQQTPPPQNPPPQQQPPQQPPQQAQPASQWRVLATGNLGVPFTAFEPFYRQGRTELFAGRQDANGKTALYFLRWDGRKMAIVQNHFLDAGELIDLTTGDMVNYGQEQAIAIFEDTIHIFDENLETESFANPGLIRISIGDFGADGQNEVSALMDTGDQIVFALFRFYMDGEPELVALNAESQDDDLYFQKGVYLPQRGYHFATFYDNTIENWTWSGTDLDEGPMIELPSDPVTTFYAFRENITSGAPLLATGHQTAAGESYILLWSLGQDGNFHQKDRIAIPGSGHYGVVAGRFTSGSLELLAWETSSSKYVIFGR